MTINIWKTLSTDCVHASSSSSSLSMACPVIWSRQYDCLFSSSVFVMLSTSSPASFISLLQASFHLVFGRSFLLFHGVCNMRINMLLFHRHHMAVPLESVLLHYPGSLLGLQCVHLGSYPSLSLDTYISVSFTSSRASCPFFVAHVSAL